MGRRPAPIAGTDMLRLWLPITPAESGSYQRGGSDPGRCLPLFLIGLLVSRRQGPEKQTPGPPPSASEGDSALSVAEKEPQTAGPAEAAQVTVPDVVGVKESQAREVIKEKELGIDVTGGSSDSVLPGRVISQSPEEGITARKGTLIRVQISTGPARPAKLPNASPSAQATVSPTVPEPAPSPLEITRSDVTGFLERWLVAQNARRFPEYSRLYSNDFVGIKRTASGGKRQYRRSGWLSDRRKMMSRNSDLSVSIDNVQMNTEGNWAEVSFIQYFRAGNYSDWGPKVLRIRTTPSGERIFFEELSASYRLE